MRPRRETIKIVGDFRMSQLDYNSRKNGINTRNPQLRELPLLTVEEYEQIVYQRPLIAEWMADMLHLVLSQRDTAIH